MTGRRPPCALRQRVIAESGNGWVYCHSLTSITGARPVIDHIIPEAAGGQTVWDNLCLACHSGHECKGAYMAAQDPLTGERVHLFHPRLQVWSAHCCWSEDGSQILGLTPAGRATVAALNMNHPTLVEARRRWTRVGGHPPEDDTPYFAIAPAGANTWSRTAATARRKHQAQDGAEPLLWGPQASCALCAQGLISHPDSETPRLMHSSNLSGLTPTRNSAISSLR